ncbi:hypothetical protein [Bradyrhizobium sp. AZCC 2289]|uniref:hypothetical protein n=1 Tax=Bradyrhizobium sp. AZCC 2289 TaxID=3117026 RepID=UPI002FEF3188
MVWPRKVASFPTLPWRDTATDFSPAYARDELRYAVRLNLFLRPEQDTMTFRNNASQAALPIRSFSGFLPSNGVGGAGVNWNGQTWRFLPRGDEAPNFVDRFRTIHRPEQAKLLTINGAVSDRLSPLIRP